MRQPALLAAVPFHFHYRELLSGQCGIWGWIALNLLQPTSNPGLGRSCPQRTNHPACGQACSGLASLAGLHGEACFVPQRVSREHLQCETHVKCLNYATVSMCATFHPNNNENVSLISSFDALLHPLLLRVHIFSL